MTSNREKVVRTLDDETKNIAESARDIAKQLDIKSWRSIANIILLKRHGFNSRKDYTKYNFQKRGFNNEIELLNYRAKKRKYRGYCEYREQITQKNGFLNMSEYNIYLRNKSSGKFRNKRDFQERKGLLKGLEYIDSNQLDRHASLKDHSLIGILEQEDRKEKITNLLNKILNELKESWREVIKKRFYERKTLEEVGEELEMSYERVRQIETIALKRLYYLVKQSELYDFYADRENSWQYLS